MKQKEDLTKGGIDVPEGKEKWNKSNIHIDRELELYK